VDELDRFAKKVAPLLAHLKPFLEDDKLLEIMAPIRSVTCKSLARDAIERASVATCVIYRAMNRK
jgi:hypothetical protein